MPDALARCDRDIADLLARVDGPGDTPVWIPTLGLADLVAERRLIEMEMEAKGAGR